MDLHGTSGIPIAIYPETEAFSNEGAAAINKERCIFLKKFTSGDNKYTRQSLNPSDTAILQSVMASTASAESRKKTHTMDYQICNTSNSTSKTLCLTLMNLSDTAITVGLSPQSTKLSCPYLVRISARSAHAVEVVFSFQDCKGIFNSIIDVISTEFQNIPIHVTGFVGQPIFFRMSCLYYNESSMLALCLFQTNSPKYSRKAFDVLDKRIAV